MANRILILDNEGAPICAMDGHHGASHAAAWIATTLAHLAEQGIEATVVELHPAQGGDAVRRGVVGNLHRLRMELHARPDGGRELVGLVLHPAASRDDAVVAGGLTMRQVAGTATRIEGAVRLLAAPAHVVGDRHPIRISNNRREPGLGATRDPQAARLARRAAKSKRARD